MRIPRSAFARRSSGFVRPMSANSFPLPSTPPIILAMGPCFFRLLQPGVVFFRGPLETRLNQSNFSFRRLGPRLRFFLKCMQNKDAAGESNRVGRTIYIAVEIIDDLKNCRSAKLSKGFRVAVLSAMPGDIERKTYRILDLYPGRPRGRPLSSRSRQPA